MGVDPKLFTRALHALLNRKPPKRILYPPLCSDSTNNAHNFHVFNFCIGHAIRKYFNNENFVIYGTLLSYSQGCGIRLADSICIGYITR